MVKNNQRGLFMRKKTGICLLIIAQLLWLAGCSKKAGAGTPGGGQLIENGIYKNSALGIYLVIPEGWHMSEEYEASEFEIHTDMQWVSLNIQPMQNKTAEQKYEEDVEVYLEKLTNEEYYAVEKVGLSTLGTLKGYSIVAVESNQITVEFSYAEQGHYITWKIVMRARQTTKLEELNYVEIQEMIINSYT